LLSTLGPSPRLDRYGLDRFGLDRFGTTRAIGGLVLGLIALFSSYDHITIAGTTLQLQLPWGIVFILASVATVFVVAEGFCAAVAQLASRFLLLDTPRTRLQLRAAVALLMEQLRPG
jgi:hypothetical protein